MAAVEINFDGLIGPSHNYAGLSAGNVASAINEGAVSRPRDAALQGLQKMLTAVRLGLRQGFFPPSPRPTTAPLRAAGFGGSDGAVLSRAATEEPDLFRACLSASSMWTANAATVIAAPDACDTRVHLVTANLGRMLHRSLEAGETEATLRAAFADLAGFAVHGALPHAQHFGDEGAANHMRVCAHHGARGLNIFVYGSPASARFPARQAPRASRAVARLAGLTGETAVFVEQSAAAIDLGAFHNDVVAVANENMLLVHTGAFEDQPRVLADLKRRMPTLAIHEVQSLSLEDAVATYLFNSQIVTLPGGGMAIIVPREVDEHPAARHALDDLLEADNPVTRAIVVDVRESMRNGGGPACLRLRVPVEETSIDRIDPRFLLDERRIDALSHLVERTWPAKIAPSDLADPDLWEACHGANEALAALMAGWPRDIAVGA